MTGAVATGGEQVPVRRPAPALELALFAALAALALGLWARLVSDPPFGRALLALAILTAAGALLIAIGRTRGGSRRRKLAAAAVAIAATLAAMVAVGLPARLLAPGNWGELADQVGVGLAGIEDSDLPYAGDDVWLRLTLLLGAPLLVGLAAGLAFWPGGRRERRRILALIALIAAFGVAVTLHSPGGELGWGLLLVVLAAAWLWLPGMALRRAGAAIAATAAAAAVAVPLAAAIEREDPWWNYEGWNWFGGERRVSFDWDHSYGPLDWPQEGTTLLRVRSERPHYWKAEVLDRFDGFAWKRAVLGDANASPELAGRLAPLGPGLTRRHPEWVLEAAFEVRALRSPFVVAPGSAFSVAGISAVPGEDGTTPYRAAPLDMGDQYRVVAYAPQPSPTQMQAAPSQYPPRARASTVIGLSPSDAGVPGVAPPLWGEPRPGLGAALAESSYADVYELARRLTARASTPYEAARAVETHLRRNYAYSTEVPEHEHALPAFLFEDRRGYCQQFSGAMALMLRMVGIPSRVVAGFAPGEYDLDGRRYEITDLDAHSWVEVFFRGIGWVPFDPTPAAAPAVSTGSTQSLAAFLRGGVPLPSQEARPVPRPDGGGDRAPRPAAAASEGDGGPWGTVVLAGLGVTAASAVAIGILSTRRRRRLEAGAAADDQLDELIAALQRFGWRIEPGTTLLALERRFTGIGRRGVARYLAALRRSRFEGDGAPPPGSRERRALRAAIASGGGLRRHWRALLAIPPGGPAPRAR